MALIVISIRDNNGAVDVSVVDEPPVAPDATEFTPAQNVAAAALNAIKATLTDEQPRIITLNPLDLN